MNSAVVDAEALGEFLDKAEPLLDSAVLAALDRSLAARTERVRAADLPWEARWRLAPAGRRVGPEDRARWEPELEPVWRLAAEGRADELMAQLERRAPAPPPWLLDWATYWLYLRHPRFAWWARWVYRQDGGTGALPLVTGDMSEMDRAGVGEAYGAVQQEVRFLGSVLESTHRLGAVSDDHRPMVALAAVYAVYMFTMSAWKLSEEFTKVFPPFPVVVSTLLGVNRWEARHSG